jgi:hypothetical protein
LKHELLSRSEGFSVLSAAISEKGSYSNAGGLNSGSIDGGSLGGGGGACSRCLSSGQRDKTGNDEGRSVHVEGDEVNWVWKGNFVAFKDIPRLGTVRTIGTTATTTCLYIQRSALAKGRSIPSRYGHIQARCSL